jgi:hypothetical protein
VIGAEMPTGTDKYQEIIQCEADETAGLVFIKVVSMPYLGSIEFNTNEAQKFAHQILDSVEKIKKAGW